MIGTQWITECSCMGSNGGRRDRKDLFNCPRFISESHVVNRLRDVISPLQKTLTVVSLASSGCFQELVLHAKILSKYPQLEKINWILIDPAYFSTPSEKTDPNLETTKEFKQRIHSLAPGSTVACFKHHEAFFQQIEEMEEKPSLFLGIHLGQELDKESNIPGVSIKEDYKNQIKKLKYPVVTGIENKETRGLDIISGVPASTYQN